MAGLLDVAAIARRLDASEPRVRSMLRSAEQRGLVRAKLDRRTGLTLYFAQTDIAVLTDGTIVAAGGPPDAEA